jgi:flagellar hook assembly protein FlgD
VYNNTISVVWQETLSGSTAVYLSQSTNGGTGFSADVDLTTGLSAVTGATVATDASGNLEVPFAMNVASTGRPQIFFLSVSTAGKISTPIAITNDSGSTTAPTIFIGSDNVIRLGFMDSSSQQYEAYYAESDDDGQTFNAFDVSNQAHGGVIATIGKDAGGNLYEAWEDTITGQFQIYSATGGAGGAVASLAATPATFSPNGDGVQDTTAIAASFTESVNWTLTITDANGNAVNAFSGTGNTMSVNWTGANASGAIVSSGTYTATVSGTANGVAFPSSAVSVTVNLNPTPAIYTFSASPLTFDPTTTSTVFSAQFTVPMTWTLNIYAAGNLLENTYTSTAAAGSASVSWNGVNSAGVGVASGQYIGTITASAGGTMAQASAPVNIQSLTPTVTNFSVSPNPFSPSQGQSTTFAFTLNETCLVTIQIYNSANALVAQPARGNYNGSVAFTWNGTNSSGVALTAGNYQYKVFARNNAYERASPYPITGTVQIQ